MLHLAEVQVTGLIIRCITIITIDNNSQVGFNTDLANFFQ